MLRDEAGCHRDLHLSLRTLNSRPVMICKTQSKGDYMNMTLVSLARGEGSLHGCPIVHGIMYVFRLYYSNDSIYLVINTKVHEQIV